MSDETVESINKVKQHVILRAAIDYGQGAGSATTDELLFSLHYLSRGDLDQHLTPRSMRGATEALERVREELRERKRANSKRRLKDPRLQSLDL